MTPVPLRYAPVGYCIYCGTEQGPITDEHIIPLALNGNIVLPKASCETCADITKKFEQTVARTIYGPYRVKQGFRTRRKKDRPKALPLYTVDDKGAEIKIDTPIHDYPNIFIAIEAPPPGVLLGVKPTDRNPELKLSLKGDPAAVNRAMDSLSIEQMITKHSFEWSAFFRQLAKIGHCYAFACTRGKKYESLLPDIILGKSQHLSHYVGGAGHDSPPESTTTDLSLSIICKPSGDYLVVGIQLLGVGTLHPYQVVAGRIPDLEAFVTASIETNNKA
jgi:hypothetical protein